jgi:UDP-glucose 4-epimerase
MQIEGSRFLVTGGSGFVGSHVVDALVAADAGEVVVFEQNVAPGNLDASLASGRVHVVRGDVRDTDALRAAAEGAQGVFHLAVLPLGPSVENPRLCLEVNVVGTFNVVEAAQQAGAQKVVFSSASSVYGDTDETMDEAHPLDARTMYGASKIAGEYFLRAFNGATGLDYVVLRYMNVYGPRQAGGLVPAVLARIRAGRPPVIAGDGSQSFDFVHVADVAAANVLAMASDVTDAALNVGSGHEVSVREITERLLHITGSGLEPEFDSEQPVLMRRRVGSNEKLVRLLGWRPAYDLDAGLRNTVAASGVAVPAG